MKLIQRNPDIYATQIVGCHEEVELLFQPRAGQCGHIKDGVGFAHGEECGWVIAYEDLIEMTRLALEARTQ